jgi:hypothetical protein
MNAPRRIPKGPFWMVDAPAIPRGIAAKIRWVIDHHPWIWLLVGVEQLATDHILRGVIFLIVFVINLFVYEMWERFSQLAKRIIERWLGEGQVPAPGDMLNRLAATERSIAQNKADHAELRTRVEMLTTAFRARDAESIIRRADQIIMATSTKLLNEPESYANEPAWAADFAAWKKSMGLVDNIMQQWDTSHKSFFDIRPQDFERGTRPPPHSNIKSEVNATRYKTVGIAQQRYADIREGILLRFDLKARDLPE